MTQQAVDALLAALNVRSGAKLLDVARGPGYVAAEAARRGAEAIGTDIAKDMVSEARRRFAGTKFEVADAEHLHYADASFDAVTCAFGMLHFPRPGKAVTEAYRVLRRNGRFAFSVWCGPAKAKVLALIAESVQQHADGSVAPPAGPGLFALSDPWILTALMEAASFTDVRIDELPCFYAPAAPSGLFDMMRKSMVRATYVYEALLLAQKSGRMARSAARTILQPRRPVKNGTRARINDSDSRRRMRGRVPPARGALSSVRDYNPNGRRRSRIAPRLRATPKARPKATPCSSQGPASRQLTIFSVRLAYPVRAVLSISSGVASCMFSP